MSTFLYLFVNVQSRNDRLSNIYCPLFVSFHLSLSRLSRRCIAYLLRPLLCGLNIQSERLPLIGREKRHQLALVQHPGNKMFFFLLLSFTGSSQGTAHSRLLLFWKMFIAQTKKNCYRDLVSLTLLLFFWTRFYLVGANNWNKSSVVER